jgi:hypothetical protein
MSRQITESGLQFLYCLLLTRLQPKEAVLVEPTAAVTFPNYCNTRWSGCCVSIRRIMIANCKTSRPQLAQLGCVTTLTVG